MFFHEYLSAIRLVCLFISGRLLVERQGLGLTFTYISIKLRYPYSIYAFVYLYDIYYK
jgi:hypothetical protein